MMYKHKDIKMRKLSVLLICIILSLSLVSCAVKPIESSESELRSVGSVGDTEIAYEELRFIVLTYKKSLSDSYGDDVFDDDNAVEMYEKEMIFAISDIHGNLDAMEKTVKQLLPYLCSCSVFLIKKVLY